MVRAAPGGGVFAADVVTSDKRLRAPDDVATKQIRTAARRLFIIVILIELAMLRAGYASADEFGLKETVKIFCHLQQSRSGAENAVALSQKTP